MKQISTVQELVAAYGGTDAMAQWADVGKSCISNWKKDGIPPGWHLHIYLDAWERQWVLAPEIFNLSKWPSDLMERPMATAE